MDVRTFVFLRSCEIFCSRTRYDLHNRSSMGTGATSHQPQFRSQRDPHVAHMPRVIDPAGPATGKQFQLPPVIPQVAVLLHWSIPAGSCWPTLLWPSRQI